MRSQFVLFLASLVAFSPLAVANHPVSHAQPQEAEPIAALVEMATDGYVLQITRPSEQVFEVRVLHRQSFFTLADLDPWETPLGQYASDRVDVLGPASQSCATAADCGNSGLWLHGLRLISGNPAQPCDMQVPLDGCFAPQTLEVLSEASGTFARITLDHDFEPTYVGSAIAVVPIALDDGETDWVRGFFNTLKVALPLDVLDAVPEPVRVS